MNLNNFLDIAVVLISQTSLELKSLDYPKVSESDIQLNLPEVGHGNVVFDVHFNKIF